MTEANDLETAKIIVQILRAIRSGADTERAGKHAESEGEYLKLVGRRDRQHSIIQLAQMLNAARVPPDELAEELLRLKGA